MKRFAFATASLLLGLAVFSAQNPYAQSADRGIITGVVTDASGGAVPDAKVVPDLHGRHVFERFFIGGTGIKCAEATCLAKIAQESGMRVAYHHWVSWPV